MGLSAQFSPDISSGNIYMRQVYTTVIIIRPEAEITPGNSSSGLISQREFDMKREVIHKAALRFDPDQGTDNMYTIPCVYTLGFRRVDI